MISPQSNTFETLSKKVQTLLDSARDAALVGELKILQQLVHDLGNQQAELEHYFNSGLDLLCIADTDGHFLKLNPQWERTLGYSLKELENRLFLDFVHPDDREATRKAIARLDSQETILNFENRYRHKDGSYRWIEWRSIPRGKLIYAAARDITERKRAEEALWESEQRFRHIFQHVAVGIARVSLDFTITSANEAYCQMLGMTETELVGKTIRDITHPEVVEENLRLQAQLAVGEIDHFRMEKRFIHTDGHTVHGILDANLVRHVDGTPAYFLGSVLDITQRKKMEEALRESEEKYRLLVENANEVVLVAQDGVIRFVNSRVFDLIGYKPEELIGKPFAEHIHPDDRATVVDRHMRRMSGADLPGFYSFRVVDRDGRMKWAEINAVRIEWQGKAATLNILTDITERRKAEAEREKLQELLLQAQKMESVGRLAGGVAHDFNNMLGVILGHAELAKEQIEPVSPVYADLVEIQKAARRSADLTRQLLAFARRQTVSPRVLNLNETVEGMLKMLRRLIGEDIELLWRPGMELWPVHMDPSQFDQVLANLMVNARDAISGVGKIIIETANTTFEDVSAMGQSDFRVGDFVQLAVSDDGCGMEKETLGKLFEPFFTTKGVGRGTGLGLATVYGIVKQNNGFINVYSEPGRGATFRIYLPRHRGAIGAASLDKVSGIPRGRGETVLLVEDEPAILNLTKTMLTGLDYRVLEAGSPGQAITLSEAFAGEIHLLLTDVVMPAMNGRDLAGRLCVLRPKLKTLFMSGYPADAIAHHGLLDAEAHLIQKPFSKDRLAARLREVLDG